MSKIFVATQTVNSVVSLVKPKPSDGDDKLTITNDMDLIIKGKVERRGVNFTMGDKIRKGDLLPCFERDFIKRGILVEGTDVPAPTETMQDIDSEGSEVSYGHADGSKKETDLKSVTEQA